MKLILLLVVFYTTSIVNAANLRGNGERKTAPRTTTSSSVVAGSLTPSWSESYDDGDSADSVKAALDTVHKILASSNTGVPGNSRKVSAASAISTATTHTSLGSPSSATSATTLTGNSKKQPSVSAPAPTIASFLPLL